MLKQGKIIAEFIKAAGYTQKEVADLIDVGEQHFSRQLNREPVPRLAISKICLAFHVAPDQLLDLTFKPPYRKAVAVKHKLSVELPDAEEQDLRAERDRLKNEVAALKDELERSKRIIDALAAK